ncbi:hypothetical protein ES703_48384 [subsurface metagenome]
MTAKNDAEALREYMESYKEYHEKLDEYFPVRQVVPGQEIKPGKALTEEILFALDKLANEVEEKRKIWRSFLVKD